MKTIKPEEFFSLIASHSGINDIDAVRRIYYGMVRTISRELKEKHIIKLPDWGEFYIVVQKSRKNMAVVGDGKRIPHILPPIPMVKFTPDFKVKKYFQGLGT